MWEIFLFVCAVWAVAIVGNIVLFAVEEREHRRELAEDAAYPWLTDLDQPRL